jgi:hypothetical protein
MQLKEILTGQSPASPSLTAEYEFKWELPICKSCVLRGLDTDMHNSQFVLKAV